MWVLKMKAMKKIIFSLTGLAAAFALASCGQDTTVEETIEDAVDTTTEAVEEAVDAVTGDDDTEDSEG